MTPRSTPDTRAKIQRSYGRCFDCFGKGERPNIVRALVQCPTCNGSGHLDEYTVCQLAQASELTVAKTLDALLDLEEQGAASCRLEHGVGMWRIKRAASQSSHRQVSG